MRLQIYENKNLIASMDAYSFPKIWDIIFWMEWDEQRSWSVENILIYWQDIKVNVSKISQSKIIVMEGTYSKEVDRPAVPPIGTEYVIEEAVRYDREQKVTIIGKVIWVRHQIEYDEYTKDNASHAFIEWKNILPF